MKKSYTQPVLSHRGQFRTTTAGLGRFLRDRVIPVGRRIP